MSKRPEKEVNWGKLSWYLRAHRQNIVYCAYEDPEDELGGTDYDNALPPPGRAPECIRVSSFSIGFGPVLFERQRRGVQFAAGHPAPWGTLWPSPMTTTAGVLANLLLAWTVLRDSLRIHCDGNCLLLARFNRYPISWSLFADVLCRCPSMLNSKRTFQSESVHWACQEQQDVEVVQRGQDGSLFYETL